MQHLLFRLGHESVAVAAGDIDAVLPCPDLEALTLAPAHLAGLLRYRGQSIPVLDLNVLRGGKPCQRLFSTRIILVKGAEGAGLGLLVEEAMDMLDLEMPETIAPEALGAARHWLAPMVFNTEQGLVQVIDWRDLLTPELRVLTGDSV
jgi:chemotaxis signal transduction protein